jgi:hypothetical protein
MPVAICNLSPNLTLGDNAPSEIIKQWGRYSGIDASEMTVTLLRAKQQAGKQYGAICTLQLPNIWSVSSVSKLQLGLAKAISEHYRLGASDVLVMTSYLDSGFVVEGGEEIHW